MKTMKKILSIFMAGAMALTAISCHHEEFVVFDPYDMVAPKLNELTAGPYTLVEGEAFETFTYSKAEYGVSTPVMYTLFGATAEDKSDAFKLGTMRSSTSMPIAAKDLNNQLLAAGIAPDTPTTVYFWLSADMYGENSIIAGTNMLSNVIKATVSAYDAEITYKRVWMPGTPNGWNHEKAQHLFNYSGDGATYVGVACFITEDQAETSGNQFKFTGEPDWDNDSGNWGVADPSAAAESHTLDLLNGSNDNITQYTTYKYYNFKLDVSNFDGPVLTMNKGFNSVSVIGSIAGTGWDTDFEMTQDPYRQIFYVDLENVTAGSEFKFRFDNSWDFNLGGDVNKLSNGGDNLKIEEDGNYRIFLDINDWDACTASWSTSKYGAAITDPYSEGGDEPVNPDVPVAPEGYGIVGSINGWGNDADGNYTDIMMSGSGVYTGYFYTKEANAEVKIRKDGSWSENYGGNMTAYGEPFEALPDGSNIALAEPGFYKMVFDATAEPKTITVYSGDDAEVWSLIGSFNGWAGDVDMTGANGVWTSPATTFTAGTEVKIRHNHDWSLSVGGVLEALGTPFAAVSDNGPNFVIPENGTFIITYDTNDQTITVATAGWGVVGSINGWGGTPDIPLKAVEGKSCLVAKNIAVSASDEIKIRYNNDWNQGDYGAPTNLGHSVKAVAKGSNIKPGVDGAIDVYFFERDEVVIVAEAGAEVNYWGVVGTINGWGAPDFIMYEKEDGVFAYDNLAITASDEIKVRMNEDWGVNRGGSFTAMDEAFEVTQDGPNMKVGGDGVIFITYDSAAETVTISGEADVPEPVEPGDYNEYIYAIGSDTNWSDVYYLSSSKEGDAFTGKYKGFGWLSGEFKFKPNEGDWSGDWEFDGEGKIADNGGSNCPGPETAGYYMIEVDLTAMTYSLTLIKGIGVVGPAQAGGWDADTDLEYDPETKLWTGTMSLDAGEYKFRGNDDWAINWGGALDALVQNGGNMAITEAGTYAIELAALCDGKAYAKLTAEGGAVATGITIDGDMSDWAAVEGASGEGINAAFKVASDEDNVYFYVRRTTERMADLWGGNGYHYYCFDLDNDPATGVELWGNGPFELLLVVYPYAGSADAPAFGIAKGGATMPENYSVDNAVIKGVVTDNGVETEVAIPRADLPAMAGITANVYEWSNKGGSDKLEVTVTL